MEDEDERYRLIRCSWKHILEERRYLNVLRLLSKTRPVKRQG